MMVTGRVHTQNRRTATTLNPLLTVGNLWGTTTTLNLKRTHKELGGVGSGRGRGCNHTELRRETLRAGPLTRFILVGLDVRCRFLT